MATPFETIREQQKQTWNNFSPGWKKWDSFNMKFLEPMGKQIISALKVKPTDHILDIATGTGEPGLTLAAMVPQGKVIGQDISEGMLVTATEHAAQKGLSNYETVNCDVSELPFPDNSFDAISCRMGFMFFPDMQKAASEMARVLKPGGRLAASVWGAPAANLWTAGLMGVISKNMEMPSPPPGAPGMFRCAQPGMIAGFFTAAGLKQVIETEVSGEVDYGSFDFYWQMMTEVAAPVVAAMSKADDQTKAKIRSDVKTLLSEKAAPASLKLPFSSLIIAAVKEA